VTTEAGIADSRAGSRIALGRGRCRQQQQGHNERNLGLDNHFNFNTLD
jgi:hypothetical protein